MRITTIRGLRIVSTSSGVKIARRLRLHHRKLRCSVALQSSGAWWTKSGRAAGTVDCRSRASRLLHRCEAVSLNSKSIAHPHVPARATSKDVCSRAAISTSPRTGVGIQAFISGVGKAAGKTAAPKARSLHDPVVDDPRQTRIAVIVRISRHSPRTMSSTVTSLHSFAALPWRARPGLALRFPGRIATTLSS